MPLRYVSYECITAPLALTSLGTPKLHSSPISSAQHWGGGSSYSDTPYSDISKWVMQWVRVRIRVRDRVTDRVRVKVRVRVRVRVSVSCAFSEAYVGIESVGIGSVGIGTCTLETRPSPRVIMSNLVVLRQTVPALLRSA